MEWSMMFLLNSKKKFNGASINELVKYTNEFNFNTL
jgi:hypothetical protein